MTATLYYEIIPTKLFRHNAGVLTYSSDQPLLPGQVVSIPLGRSTVIGIVYRAVPAVDFPTKSVQKLLYPTPLPTHILQAIFWLQDYYLTPLPLAANLFLPIGITKKRRAKPQSPPLAHPSLHPPELNYYQKQALKQLQNTSSHTKLLHGITGSGKTNIYLKLAQEAFEAQKSTILLVPEIALTSQLVQVFSQTFGSNVTLFHSRQTEAERHLIWEHLLQTSSPQIIIGPRSALLLPLSNLGLLIVDEAHESSYFQEQNPKYSALRLASFIAKTCQINCILGTATPLISDYYLAKNHSSLIKLNEKAKTSAINSEIQILDLKNRANFTKNRYFSDLLLQKIHTNLKNHHQTLIFHNRRGSAPLTICRSCGWQALCPTCFLPLTLHTDHYNLVCHACGYSSPVPVACPTCGHPEVIHKGFGTKLLESELQKLFKTAKIARFDADNTKHQTLDSLYQPVKTGEFDIIIGTQTVTKGLDLPLLATVGIVQADSGLSLPDFTSEERTFELLTQVIGRVGRGHLNTASVVIQTYQPNHPAIQLACSAEYSNFAKHLLLIRRAGHLPPFSHLAKISVTYKTESLALTKIRELHHLLSSLPHLHLSNPTPAFHEQSKRGFTWQIIIRSTSRQAILKAVSTLPPSNSIHFTLDPPSLLN